MYSNGLFIPRTITIQIKNHSKCKNRIHSTTITTQGNDIVGITIFSRWWAIKTLQIHIVLMSFKTELATALLWTLSHTSVDGNIIVLVAKALCVDTKVKWFQLGCSICSASLSLYSQGQPSTQISSETNVLSLPLHLFYFSLSFVPKQINLLLALLYILFWPVHKQLCIISVCILKAVW